MTTAGYINLHQLDQVEYSIVSPASTYTNLYSLSLSTINWIGRTAILISKEAAKLDVVKFLTSIKFTTACSAVGLIANVTWWVKETLSLILQHKFLAIFQNNKPQEVADEIAKISTPRLKQRLTATFYKENAESIQRIQWLGTADQKELIKKIQAVAWKRQVVNLLGWISSFIGLLGFAASFAACPYVWVAALFALSFAIFVGQYLAANGWLENPKEGFSLKLCIPPVILKYVEEAIKAWTLHFRAVSR